MPYWFSSDWAITCWPACTRMRCHCLKRSGSLFWEFCLSLRIRRRKVCWLRVQVKCYSPYWRRNISFWKSSKQTFCKCLIRTISSFVRAEPYIVGSRSSTWSSTIPKTTTTTFSPSTLTRSPSFLQSSAVTVYKQKRKSSPSKESVSFCMRVRKISTMKKHNCWLTRLSMWSRTLMLLSLCWYWFSFVWGSWFWEWVLRNCQNCLLTCGRWSCFCWWIFSRSQ